MGKEGPKVQGGVNLEMSKFFQKYLKFLKGPYGKIGPLEKMGLVIFIKSSSQLERAN